MLLAEAQHRRQHSAFGSGHCKFKAFPGVFTGARKCTGKKKKNKQEKEKNQEKICVTRVDTIGDAAELLSPNDEKTEYLIISKKKLKINVPDLHVGDQGH